MSKINTYKDSAKGITVFGGIQVYKMLLSVIRTKCSALFLGPTGFGIYSLISSTLTSIEMATNCGLGTSAVKDISASSSDNKEVSRTYIILNRLVWVTGVAATLFCAFGAKWLSISAFGNDEYTWMFVIGSVSLLLNQLISGQGALMSGLRKYKYIVRLNLWTNMISLIITILFYWLWGVKAIIAVILSSSAINLIFSAYYARKIQLEKVIVTIKDTFSKGKGMIKMGIFISLSGVLTALGGYAIRIYISNTSDIATVGLFTAVFSLINTYLGLVFTSIEKDYFPRLSSIAKDSVKFETTIRQQNEILLHILAPLVTVFMVFAPLLLKVFYSSKFVDATGMMVVTVWAMFYKIPSWTLTIGFLSKGDTKTYFKSNMSFAIYSLLLNIAGFYLWGLKGIGVSYIIAYIIFMFQTYIISKRRYGFSFGKSVWGIIALYSLLLLLTCFVADASDMYIKYGIGSIMVITISFIGIKELNKRLSIINLLKRKK